MSIAPGDVSGGSMRAIVPSDVLCICVCVRVYIYIYIYIYIVCVICNMVYNTICHINVYVIGLWPIARL